MPHPPGATGATLHLRTARPADLDAIMSLEFIGFDDGIRETASVFTDRLETFAAGFIVSEDACGLDGYLCSERWPGSAASSSQDYLVGHSARERHDPRGSVLYISSMTVRPVLRGQGLGRHFFRSSMDLILGSQDGIESTRLIVNETWLPARRIYASEGFVEVRRLPAFFEPFGIDPQDAIVMTRDERRIPC